MINNGYYSYKKNNWKADDKITSQRLNHIQEGITNTGIKFIRTIEDEQHPGVIKLSMSLKDIISYIYSGVMLFLILDNHIINDSNGEIITRTQIYFLNSIFSSSPFGVSFMCSTSPDDIIFYSLSINDPLVTHYGEGGEK